MAKNWYIVQTYSGYEQKIEKTINKLRDVDEQFAQVCTEVKVPMKEREEMINGKLRIIRNKVLPGYILVEMDLQDHNWKLPCGQIKRIQGCTGFLTAVGSAKPTPISEEELRRILEEAGEVKQEKTYKPKEDYNLGERVKIIEGPFADFTGEVEEINNEKGRLRISVQIFGRQTPVDVEFSEVEKI